MFDEAKTLLEYEKREFYGRLDKSQLVKSGCIKNCSWIKLMMKKRFNGVLVGSLFHLGRMIYSEVDR